MGRYDIVSQTDQAQTDRLAMKSLGARVDNDVRNPDVGWNSPEVVPTSTINQRQGASGGTSAQDIADAITAAIADGGEIAEWLAEKTYTTLAAVAAVGYQTATQVTALANAAIDTALALGGKIYNKAYTTIQGVIDAGFQKAAQVTALANAAITAAIANGQAIYNAISTFITNAIADAGALATWLANKTYTTLSAVQTWVNGLALASAENIYEWSAQAVHDISATDAARQLYKDATVGSGAQAQAGPLDYMQAAIFGAHDPEERTPPRMEPKTIGEWIESITDRIFAVGQDAITWLGEQGATLTSTIFGAFTTAREWLDAQGLATATSIYRWSAQAVHSISATDAARQLYKDNTSGNTEVNEAGPLDYMQAAIFGAWDPDDGNPPRMEPKTLGEWITDIAHGIFGAGKDAIAWLGERATEVKNLVFGAGVKAAQWIADTLSSTASDVQTAVGNAANAISEEVLGTTATIAESIMGFLTGDETNDNAAKATNSPPIVLTSTGDLNMQTQDMVKVDRIFFESNNGRIVDDGRSYITSYLTSGERASLVYQVPANFTHHFYSGYGDGSEILNLSRGVGAYAPKNMVVGDDLSVGLAASVGRQLTVGTLNKQSGNGAIYLDGNDIKVISGNATRSLSTLAGASPTVPQPESGRKFRMPIKYVSSRNSNSALNTAIGNEAWSAGIITTVSTSSINYNSAHLVYFYWRNVAAGHRWLGFQFDMNVSTGSITKTGTRGTDSINKRRIRLIASGSPPTPTYASLLATTPKEYGVWGAYTDTGTSRNGAVTVISHLNPNQIRYRAESIEGPTANSGTSSTVSYPLLPAKLKVIRTAYAATNPSTTQLDSDFGEDDGAIGMYLILNNTGRLYIKVNGYWFYKEMTAST